MNNAKVAIVTGSNKGIGFYIVQRLCKDFNGDVFLTARNIENGQKAIQNLNEMGLKAKFHQLDIENKESIDKFNYFIKNTYGGIDILVNNAGVYPQVSEELPFVKCVKDTMNINYFGTLDLCNSLFSLLRSNARVVNVSSKLGLLTRVKNEDLRKKISNLNNSINDITQIVNDYIKSCENETYKSLGFPDTAYEMSKVALCAITRLQQKQIDQDTTRTNIKISSVTPGYCMTDMTSNKGYFTAEQGADTPYFLTQLSNDIDGGQFWSERKVCDWINEEMVF